MVGHASVQDADARAEAVAELSLSLAALTTDVRRLEQLVVERIGELVGDAAALWRMDERGELQLRAFHHADPEVRRHMLALSATATHSTEQGVLPHAWAATQPLLLSDGTLEQWLPLMQPAYQEYVRAHGMVSLVLVPLRVRGDTVALLGASRDAPPMHRHEDVRFLAQVGAVAAVALDNVRLLRSLEREVREQRRARAAAERASLHDSLTGLPNRRKLVADLHVLREERPESPAALLLVDLDRFKAVNDLHGHERGDGVLLEIAARLAEAVLDGTSRELAAGDEPVLVRLGADEFAVLLVGPDSGPRGKVLARELLAALAPPLLSLEEESALGASIGVAVGRAADAEELLHRADIAMYRAKETAAGWTVYEPAVDTPARMRLRDLGELQEALRHDQLVVHYQPLVSRRPGQPLRLEALVRWQHPDRGLLPPLDFLPLAQSTGLMTELTRQVLRRALADLARWRRTGLDVQVSVNVTSEGLAVPDLVEELLDRVAAHGLTPGALCVELTESELLVTSGLDGLRALRRAGVTVAIDDFGTGYSSLAYLADLPLDLVKLDQSFVRRLEGDGRSGTLVGGLVDFLHDLGIHVVAEGVETPEQAGVLDGFGVEWQQGFLHSRPLPAEDVGPWLSRQA